jgi:hypothetical protein
MVIHESSRIHDFPGKISRMSGVRNTFANSKSFIAFLRSAGSSMDSGARSTCKFDGCEHTLYSLLSAGNKRQ